jgi:hypothetical protein
MINQSEAVEFAKEFLSTLAGATPDDPWVVQENMVKEGSHGWALPFVNKHYLESGDWRDERLGHSSLIVDRRDGSVHLVPSNKQIDLAIEEYDIARRQDP